MGQRGRTPRPTAEMAAKGNRHAIARIHAGEPVLEIQPAASIDLPGWVGERARNLFPEIWEVLDNLKVITQADRMALGMLCERLQTYVACRDFIEQNGMTEMTQDGMSRKRPECSIMTEAWNGVVAILKQFGATPATRTNVRQVKEPDTASKASRFFKGG